MHPFSIASASLAALVALAVFDAKPAEARKGFSFSASRASSMGSRSVFRSNKVATTRMTTRNLSGGTKMKLGKSLGSKNLASKNLGGAQALKKVGNVGGNSLKKGNLGQASLMKPVKLNLGGLPKHKGVMGKGMLVGRLAVPKNIKPKLTLGMMPKPHLSHAFGPFVQRHWKKSFFWVAVAGIGWVTVPELYYSRFHSCSSVANPDYDECVRILSYAALEEEERVRMPMPASATYRYTAKVQPTREARQTCSFEPFVERKWNREFVWVQIPETGNVTVPEEVYDLFNGKVDGEPPDYVAACKVLVEAAAADTIVATTGPDLGRNL